MGAENKKFILIFFLTLAIILFWPFFPKAQESVTLNPPSPGCLGSQAFVNLSWTSTIDGSPTYFVLRKIQGEPDTSYIQATSTQNLSYTDKLVDSDKNYIYKIRAEKGAHIYYSNEETALAAYCPPVISPPTSSCQADGPHINLTWTAVSGDLSTYEVYRDETKIHSTTGTVYDDGPNIEGTKTYNYYIKAIWQNGNSTTSENVPIIALACPPTLTATADCNSAAPGGPRVNLSWNSLLGVQNYQIYRQAQAEAGFTLLKTSTSTTYADNLVESLPTSYWQGGEIYYYVKAIWATDQQNSSQKQITIPRCAPFLKVESNCDEFSFRLSWIATEGTNKYNIYREGAFLIQISGVTSISYTDGLNTNICPGQICTLTYQVIAVDTFSISSNSVAASIDCATIIPPSPAPVLNTPQDSCVGGDSRIKNSWSSSNNVTYYSLYRVGATTSEFKLRETTHEDKGVESGIEYTYYVTAWGKGGTSTTSENSVTITAVDCTPPSIPILNLSTGCATGSPYVNLSWSSTTNTLSYDIYRGPSATTLNLLITFDKNSPEFTTRTWRDTGVSTSTTHYYKVVSNGPTGVPSSSSTVQSITTLFCLPNTPSLTITPACQGNNPVMNLSWTAGGPNTAYYEIFRQDYLGGTSPYQTIPNPNTTSWTDGNVLSDTSYTYKIDAIGFLGNRVSQGWRPPQNALNCTAPGPFTLTDPPNVFCQGSYPRSDLSWTSSTNAVSYDLLRNRLNPDETVAEATTFTNTTSPFSDLGFGNALSFDGYYDYVNIPSAESLNPTRITLESWIYPTAFNYYGNIITKRASGQEQYILRLYGYTGQVQGYIYSGGWRACTTPFNIAVSLNRWNHIAFTYDGTTGRVYVNGVPGCTFSYTGNIASGSSPLRIGTYYTYTGGTSSERFKGIIDEARIYNRALSSTETQEHYQGIYSNETGLIGLWHFDEGSGQTVSDSSNYGNNGTRGPSTATETSDPAWVSSGLQSQTKYNWQVKAIGPGGTTLSNTTTPATLPLCPPTKPGLVLSTTCLAEGMPIVNGSFSFSINASSYEIYREGKGLISTTSQTVDPSLRTFADSDVLPSTPYTYWVNAIGSGGVTESDHLSITTLACLGPTKPENLTATSTCGGTGNSYPRVNLSWATSTNASYYTIYRTPTTAPFPVTTSLTSYTDTAVAVSSTYSYYVISYASGGLSSSSSDPVSATTGYCTPSTPSITSLTTGCETNNPVNTISWSDATTFNTTEYRIYRNTSDSPPAVPIITIASTTAEFSTRTWKDNLGLSSLNTYYYWAKAVGPAGGSALSSSKSISTYSCGLTPGTPTLNLDELYCSDNLPQTTLRWNTVANAYSYNLYRTNPDNSTSIYSTRLSPLTDRGSFALKFDGIDDYVEIGNVNPTSAITVEAWVKSDNTTGYSGVWQIVSKYSAYILGTNSTGGKNVCFLIYNSSGWQYGSCYSVPDPQNWHHFVGTYDSTTGAKKLYVDGSLRDTTTPGGTIYPDTGPLHIARRECCDGYNFKGVIDEVSIYSRALSSAEVLEHFQGIYRNETGLEGAWHFDEGSGNNVLDNSGQGNNGTMTNMDPAVSWVKPTGEPNIVLPLENEKNYSYRVKAFGADTESAPSNEISFTAPSCLPAKPNLVVTPQCEASNSQIKLSWQPDPNTISWTIHKKREGETWDYKPPWPITTTLTSYIDIDVSSGSNYEYYVVAVGKDVITTSDALTQTAPFCYEPPYGGTPFSISATSVCYGYSVRNKVEWPTDETQNTLSYNIWRKNTTQGEADFSTISVGLGSTALSYLDVNVLENDKYLYKVEAVGSGEGNTLFSNTSTEVTALECSTKPPDPPALFLDGIDSTADLRAAYMHWTDAGNEDYYVILRASSAFAEIATTSGYEIPTTVYWVDSSWDRELNDGQTYYYKIIAYNINGGTESIAIDPYIPRAKPGAFTLTGSKVGATICLTWTEAATTTAGGVATYKILRDSNSAFGSYTVICENITSSPFECYDNSPSFYEEYYKAVATNLGGLTDSNVIRIILPPPIWKEIAPGNI